MCGRYQLLRPQDIASRFAATAQLELLPPNADVRPTQLSPVVLPDRRIELLRWGLIPSWAKDPHIGAKLINARAETVAQKPAFRTSLRFSRCLIPATGFYEWQATAGGKTKVKHLFTRADGELFGFAGLSEEWTDPTGHLMKTFTIITTTPNTVVAPIHDRMPVILTRNAEDAWLDPDETESERLLRYLTPLPAEELVVHAA